MAFDLSTAIAGDWSLFDSTDTVTIEDFDGVETSVAGVTDSPLSKQRAAMLGPTLGVEDETRVFSLPVDNLDAVVPQQGHKIIDSAGRVWAIISCDLKTMDTRWSAACVRNRQEYRPQLTWLYSQLVYANSTTLLFNGTNSSGVDVTSEFRKYFPVSGVRFYLINQSGTRWPDPNSFDYTTTTAAVDVQGTLVIYHDAVGTLASRFASGDIIRLRFPVV